MLKLFVTITGSKSKRTTPIAAPRHQLSHAVIAIPRFPDWIPQPYLRRMLTLQNISD